MLLVWKVEQITLFSCIVKYILRPFKKTGCIPHLRGPTIIYFAIQTFYQKPYSHRKKSFTELGNSERIKINLWA